MKLNILLLLLGFCFVSQFGYSQDSTIAKRKIVLGYAIQDNDEEEYRFSESTDLDDKYTRKEMFFRYGNEPDKWHSLGFLGKKLQSAFSCDEEALKEFKKYKRRLIWGYTSIVGGLVIIAPVYLLVKEYSLAIILGELAATSTLGSLALKNAEKHLYQAAQIYNSKL